MTTNEEIKQVLRRAYQIEIDGYTFYSMAADKAEKPAVAEIFGKLADDEVQHKLYLQDVMGSYEDRGVEAFKDWGHRIYSIHHRIDAVRATQAAVVRGRATSPGPPVLEGMEWNGQLAVVYSPLDLGCGWALKPNAFRLGYESRDAIRLGVNIVVYAVSH